MFNSSAKATNIVKTKLIIEKLEMDSVVLETGIISCNIKEKSHTPCNTITLPLIPNKSINISPS